MPISIDTRKADVARAAVSAGATVVNDVSGLRFDPDIAKVAAESEYVLDDPPPRAFFIGFGDNSLDFQLRIFIEDVDNFSFIRDKVNMAIDREFRKANIEIAFPQRDIHIRSVDAVLPGMAKAAAADDEKDAKNE